MCRCEVFTTGAGRKETFCGLRRALGSPCRLRGRRNERLPDFALDDGRPLGREFAALGLGSYREAARYVRSLPYGRNTDRSDWRLVLKEGRGACSTKHALLAELARENGRHVALMLGIYEMCEDNTPGIGAVLERHGLPCIPEAHCYLAHEGTRVDLTREVEGAEYIERFLHEEEIYPRQIGEYKVRAHRGFVRRWAMERGRDPDRVWRVRERCIAALERRPRIEQRVKEAGKTNLTMTSLSHGRSQGGGACS